MIIDKIQIINRFKEVKKIKSDAHQKIAIFYQ